MRIGRRHFISLLGSAVLGGRCTAAEQSGELPVIGRGLKESRFVEAQNLAIAYRFANGQIDQLPALAADLVSRPLAMIVAGGAAAAVAAKAATSTIPIALVSGIDPIKLGLVANSNNPGGNMTGVTFTTAGLMSRRLGFLSELVARATTIGYLAEDGGAYAFGSPMLDAIGELKSEVLAAAIARGWQVVVAEIGTNRDYEAAFAKFVERRASAVVVASSPVFASDADDIVALTLRHEIPAIFGRRADTVAAGLMSYGPSQTDAWYQGGVYAGQILKGANTANMPVIQSTRLELVINSAIAKSLSFTIPPALLAQADEIIQ
jgi:putative ABC transport system substrate-binding protein